MQTKLEGRKLLPYSEIIRLAKQAGVDFGKGYPYNRLRYYTKIGLLPKAQRRSFGSNPEGCYPTWVVDKLVEIDRKIKEGTSIQQILKQEKEASPNENSDSSIQEPTALNPFSQFNLAPIVLPARANQQIINSPQFLESKKSDQGFGRALAYGALVFIITLTSLNIADRLPYTTKAIEKAESLLASVFSTQPAKERIDNLLAESGEILARTTAPFLKINVDTQIDGLLNAFGGIETNGADANLGSGQLTASNVIYDVVAGENVTVSQGQTPTISVPDITAGIGSVSGTAGRITSTGGDNPVINIATNYSGQTSIGTLGTITSGDWNASTITDAFVANNLTINASGSVAWTALTSYPTSCGAGEFVQAVGDTLTCVAESGSGSFDVTDGVTTETIDSGNTLTFSSGNGVYPTVSAVDTVTFDLGNLTADWIQGGAFDIILDNANSQIQILESADDTFYGTIDVGDLSANRTYTFPDTDGTVCISGGTCDSSTLDTLDSTDFLRSNADDEFEAGNTLTLSGTLDIDGNLAWAGATVTEDLDMNSNLILNIGNAGTDFTAGGGLTLAGSLVANGTFTLGDSGDSGSVATSDWGISTTGNLTGIGSISADGTITLSGTSPQINITGVSPTISSNDQTLTLDSGTANLVALGASDILQLTLGSADTTTAVCLNSSSRLASCTGGGSSSLWTDGGTITYLTSTTDDIAVGGSTLASAFSVDVSGNLVRVGTGSSANAQVDLYASNGSTGSLSYTTNDQFRFSGGNVLVDQTATIGTSTASTGALYAAGSSYTTTVSQTNTAVDSANDVGQYNSLTIGIDGYPIISYYDATNTALRVTKCNDVACTGGDETSSEVDNAAAVGEYSSIAIGADGLPVIAYYDATNTSLKVAKCNDVACTGGDETITTVDNAGADGIGTAMAISADGFPIISYFEGSTIIKATKCNDAACTGGDETSSTVDTIATVLNITSITIGRDGLPIIGYTDAASTVGKIAKCNDVACTGGDETISSLFSGDESPSEIVIGLDGLPGIARQSHIATSFYPGFTKCSDAACSQTAKTREAIDDNEPAASTSLSMALGSDGLYVSTFTSTLGLRVAKQVEGSTGSGCTNNSNWTCTTVVAPGSIGSYNSIAIGVDGLPIVAYYDNSGLNLNIVHCANAGCTSTTGTGLTAGIDIGSPNLGFRGLYGNFGSFGGSLYVGTNPAKKDNINKGSSVPYSEGNLFVTGNISGYGNLDIETNAAIGDNNMTPLEGWTLRVSDRIVGASCPFGICIGVISTPTIGTSAPAGSAVAFYGRVDTINDTFTLPAAVSFFAANNTDAGNPTITNSIGLYLEPQTAGTNNYGICFDCDGTWSSSTVAAGIQFGTDANAANFYRSASDTLRTDDSINIGTNLILNAGGGTNSVFFGSTAAGSPRMRAAFDGTNRYLVIDSGSGGSSDNRLYLNANNGADIALGQTTSQRVLIGGLDTNIYSGTSNALRTDDQFQLSNSSTTCAVFATGGAQSCIWFGSDTNLYRSAANRLQSDDNLSIGAAAANDDDTLFFDQANASIIWDDNPGEFEISDELLVSGSLAVGNVLTDTPTTATLSVQRSYTGVDCDQGFLGLNCFSFSSVTTIADDQSEANDTAGNVIWNLVDDGNAGTGVTLTTGYGLFIMSTSLGAGGDAITNNYGLHINSQTAGGTDYALSIIGADDYGLCFDCDGTFSAGNVGRGIQWGTDSTTTQNLRLFRGNTASAANLIIEDGAGTDLINASTSVFQINLDNTTSRTEKLCHGGGDLGTGIAAVSDCSGTPGDYAEEYGTTDRSISAGDLVVIDKNKEAKATIKDGQKGSKAWIRKSKKPYQETLIGVVSTNPNDVIGKSFSPSENPRPVALDGRVPVKVSTENGDIKPGDPLTSSSTSGVAMKATKAGPVVGKALASYKKSGVGKIIAYISVGWYVAPIGSVLAESSFGGNLALDTLTANSVVLGDNTISVGLDGSIEIEGDLNLSGDFFASSVTTDELSLSDQSSGTDSISFGQDSVTVNNDNVTESSRVVVSFTSNWSPATRFWVEKNDGSFIVKLDSNLNAEASFDWFIIN